MTPSSEITISPARAHGARPPDRARARGGGWERVLAVLGVCLPVPLLALTGLSIPLPAGVERIGAALVAWADPSVEGTDPLGLGDRGSIVLASGEGVLAQAPTAPEADTARRVIASPSSAEPAAGSAKHGGTPPTNGGGGSGSGTGGNGGNGGGSSTPDPGGGDPGDEPGLVEETVKKVTEQPLVEEVDKTLDEILPLSDDESSGGVLDDALSGLGL
jgi:hypothetical protein